MTNKIKLILDHLAGIPWVPALIEPLFYQGVIAGSEFLTYGVDKLYVCSDFFAGSSTAAAAALGLITFHREGNVINLYSQNQSIAYESVAAAVWYAKNNMCIKDLYFSRIITAQYDYMKFNGWILTR